MADSMELRLRVVLADPLPGVRYCLQRTSRADCVDHKSSGASDLAFDLTVKVKPAGDAFDYHGPFVQGRRGERYVAILIGTLAGEADSCWTRAVKIHLSPIPSATVESALNRADVVLTARFPGRAKSGGPSCASIRPLDDGWRAA
jgi:hypothetical protein